MAEAFVNGFKRDSLRIHARPAAERVLAQPSGWFEDYNERPPHTGLRMKSFRKFICSSVAGCLIWQGQFQQWVYVTGPTIHLIALFLKAGGVVDTGDT